MIARISTLHRAGPAITGDYATAGTADAFRPREVAGNVPDRDWRRRAQAIDDHVARTATTVPEPIVRVALSTAATDRTLSDREWASLAAEYVERMGHARSPWMAVRTAGTHVTVTMTVRTWAGETISTLRSYLRSRAICDDLEQSHGLARSVRRLPQDPSRREMLRDLIRHAAQDSPSVHEFRARLDAAGVDAMSRMAADGTVLGWAFHIRGHLDTAGSPVWWKGSTLAPDCTGAAIAAAIVACAASLGVTGPPSRHAVPQTPPETAT